MTDEDMLASCRDLFERYNDIICNDQLYMKNRNQYDQSSPKINDIIANEVELAECYLEERKAYIDELAQANDSLLIGESASHDLHELTS